MNIIQRIKAILSLKELAKELLPGLTEKNDRLIGFCPFHADKKSPSFQIESDDRYYCYGCHATGDIIDLVQHCHQVDKKAAISWLAIRAGLTTSSREATQEEKITALRRRQFVQAHNYYKSQLKGEGKAYLTSRGLSEETIQLFGLGFSPAHSSLAQQVNQKSAIENGILALSKNDKPYDPFFNRVIFPILQGQHIVGFAGRTLIDETSPKYKNTVTTQHFCKGDVLYGLSQAASHIRKRGYGVVVEGYLDVLSMSQNSFKNTVGTMGTAVTSQQLNLLKESTDKVIFLMDGDNAGKSAAIKALSLAFHAGLKAKVAFLPDGSDPDSFLREFGKEPMAELLRTAEDGLVVLLQHLRDDSPQKLDNWLQGFLSGVTGFIQLFWAKQVAEFFGVTAKDVLDRLLPIQNPRLSNS